jgi:hypothetical protein
MEQSDTKDDKITRWIIVSAWLLCLVTVLIIVLSCVYMAVMHPEINQPALKEWGSVAIGFLFGNITNLIKDFVINSFKKD